jgi:hypothetical protein
VQVDDSVNLVLGALALPTDRQLTPSLQPGYSTTRTHDVNNSIKVLQSLLFEHTRVHVVLKVAVVDLEARRVLSAETHRTDEYDGN